MTGVGMEQKFRELVEQAKTIFISSHIAPDPDAIASALLLTETLKRNYPDKTIKMVMEEKPAIRVEFLTDYDSILFAPTYETLVKYKPDLIIITDANQYNRISRNDSAKISEWVEIHGAETVVIDHHNPTGVGNVDLFLNTEYASCVEQVYRLCFDELHLRKPKGHENTVMLGIITDTGRFKYPNDHHRETFALASDLIDAGVSIEKIESQMDHYSLEQIHVIGEYGKNTIAADEFSYSFISDEFTKAYLGAGKPYADLKGAGGIFADTYIRSIGDNKWGFIVYPDIAETGGYRVSFRSKDGVKDISKFAIALGGNGHPQSAAAPLKVQTVEEAVRTVLDLIAKS